MNQLNLDKIIDFYTNSDESIRLTKHPVNPEFDITMDYIHKYAKPGCKILEIGAGPGTYSLQLAKEGYDVTAVELVPKNLAVLRSRITENMTIKTYLGNAIDLSFLEDNTFDIVLSLGPMYHIFEKENQLKAISEASRVCKPGSYIFFAYCGLVAAIISFCFVKHRILEAIQNKDFNSDWSFVPNETSRFNIVEKKQIDALMENFNNLQRLHFVGVDPAFEMLNKCEDMSEYEAEKYLDFAKCIAEKEDCIGLNNHYLDIQQKVFNNGNRINEKLKKSNT